MTRAATVRDTAPSGAPLHIDKRRRDALAPGGAPPRPSGTDQSARERRVVVYVEDNASNVAFMVDMLDMLDDCGQIELITAPSAEIGIELIRARRPDLVLMDINLPGMSGVEATQRLASWPETRDIPVVALSAAGSMYDAAKVARAGFYRYLHKPVNVDELTAVLEQLLRRTPEIAGDR